MALNYAKLGADLKGVVSFHGGMGGVPVDKKLLKAKVLVCQGGIDKFVSMKDVDKFIHQLRFYWRRQYSKSLSQCNTRIY